MHTLLFVSGRTASAIINIATLAVILGAAAMIVVGLLLIRLA